MRAWMFQCRCVKLAALAGAGTLFQAAACALDPTTLPLLFLQGFLGILVSNAVNGFFNVVPGFGF